MKQYEIDRKLLKLEALGTIPMIVLFVLYAKHTLAKEFYPFCIAVLLVGGILLLSLMQKVLSFSKSLDHERAENFHITLRKIRRTLLALAAVGVAGCLALAYHGNHFDNNFNMFCAIFSGYFMYVSIELDDVEFYLEKLQEKGE